MINVKEGVNFEDLKMVHPALLILMGAFCLYAHENSLPVTVTSIMDDAPSREYRTHLEGRAADFSVRGWSNFHIERVCYHLNQKYKDIGAISAKDKKQRPCVYHNGNGYHVHLQAKP